MKKLLSILLVLFTALNVNAKCDWSSLKFQEWNQRNYYKYYVNGAILDDTCVDWMYTIYDQQKKKLDTLEDWRGYTDIQFNAKGKYTVKFHIWNNCTKCDTTIIREVNLIYFTQCTFNYKLVSSDGAKCQDSLYGVMSKATTNTKDTCWEYWYYIYHGKELDDLSQHDWDSMSDDQLYMYYSFNDSDIIVLEGPDYKPVNKKFTEDGHYLLVTQWYNKCLNQDTFFFTRITIETCATSIIKTLSPTVNGIKVFPNPADNMVQITLTTPTKNPMMTYEVFDSKGQVVNTGRITNNIAINTSKWTNGVYVVKIGRLTQKFIVRH